MNNRLQRSTNSVMDDDDTVGCDLAFDEDPDSDEVAALRPLFPDGDPAKADDWGELFGGATGASGETS